MQRRIARDGLLLGATGALGFALGGPPLAFSSLIGAQLVYTLFCRAPGAPVEPRFIALLGGAAVMQGAALLLPPLRALLELGEPSPLDGLGVCADLIVPWLAGRAEDDRVIVRRGPGPRSGIDVHDVHAMRSKHTAAQAAGARAARPHTSGGGAR
jgi:hypothetical protein